MLNYTPLFLNHSTIGSLSLKLFLQEKILSYNYILRSIDYLVKKFPQISISLEPTRSDRSEKQRTPNTFSFKKRASIVEQMIPSVQKILNIERPPPLFHRGAEIAEYITLDRCYTFPVVD